jgi:hypothetical protein
MQKSVEIPGAASPTTLANRIPVTVIIPTRNEARHLSRCLEAARLCSEIYVIDFTEYRRDSRDCPHVWRKGGAVSLRGWLAEEKAVGSRLTTFRE